METPVQIAPSIKEINTAAFELFKTTAEPWMDMIKGSLAKSGDAKGNGTSWRAADVAKLWSTWNNGLANNGKNIQNEAARKIITVGLEQQKLCTDLTASWLTCVTKMMEVIGDGVQNKEAPANVAKACKDLAEDYRRSCTAFIESEWALICDAFLSRGPGLEKSEKPEKTKSTGKTEKAG